MDYETFDTSNPDKPWIEMDPGEEKDYGRDFGDAMTADGDEIESFQVLVDPGLTLHGSTRTGTIVSGLVSTTKREGTYRMRFVVITTGGRTWVRSVYLKVKPR